jgi:hypothetical protein
MFDVSTMARKLRQRLTELPLVGSGAKVALRCGRIVRVRPLNLRQALALIGLAAGLVERLGWERLAAMQPLEAALMILAAGGEELADALALITGETRDFVLSELGPEDALKVLLAAWRQEFASLTPAEAASAFAGGNHD